MKNNEQPLWSLSVQEFFELFDSYLEKRSREVVQEELNNKEVIDEEVRGIIGLAQILKMSKTSAQRYKSSGLFDEAIYQDNRTITINVKKAKQIWREHCKKNNIQQ